MDVGPKPNKIKKARNGSNEKRHPPRASIKIQLQLKSRSRRQNHRKTDPKQKAASGTSSSLWVFNSSHQHRAKCCHYAWEGAPGPEAGEGVLD